MKNLENNYEANICVTTTQVKNRHCQLSEASCLSLLDHSLSLSRWIAFLLCCVIMVFLISLLVYHPNHTEQFYLFLSFIQMESCCIFYLLSSFFHSVLCLIAVVCPLILQCSIIHVVFIHCTVYVDCFQFGAVMNSCAVNILICVFWYTCPVVSLRYISGIEC